MKTVRRLIPVIAAVLMLFPSQRAAAQGASIVQDPTHIGVAVSNAANQLEETINLLTEIMNLNDIEAVANGLEKLENIINRLDNAGMMVELADQYAKSIGYAVEYAKQIQEWDMETGNLGVYNDLLRQILYLENETVSIYTALINYIKSLKTNDAEKAKEVQEAIDDMEKVNNQLKTTFAKARELTLASRSISSTITYLDRANSVDAYVRAYKSYGSTGSALKGWARFVRILLVIVFIVLIAIGVVIFFRGNATGMSVSNTVIIRIFMGALIAFMFLSIFSQLITIL